MYNAELRENIITVLRWRHDFLIATHVRDTEYQLPIVVIYVDITRIIDTWLISN